MNLRAPALALLVLAGCRVPEANVYNLREVRDPDGSPRRVGAPLSVPEYVVRRSLIAAVPAENEGLLLATPDVIDDPDLVALENLLQLSEGDRDDPRVFGLQVEMATWLAVDDTYRLMRERAVLELGPLGRRLELAEPMVLPADAVVATADDLVGPLGDLVRHVRLFVQQRAAPGEPLAATCAEIEALTLDREGARRVAAVANALLEQGGHAAPELAPLAGLFRTAARRAVALALAQALEDRDALVRAAAFRATFAACGDRLVGLRRQGLDDPAAEVLIAILTGLRERGLTIPPEVPAPDAARLRMIFLVQLVELTRDLRGTVSASACEALARLSGSETVSYRWEDWNRWFEAEVAAARASSAAAGAVDAAGESGS
jgi:hypothetical protein